MQRDSPLAGQRSVSWKYTWTYGGSVPRAPRAAIPSECVDGSSSRRWPSASVSQTWLVRGQKRLVLDEIRRDEGSRRAVGVAELGDHGGDFLVDVPAAAAEEPRLEALIAQPQRLAAAHAGRRQARRPPAGHESAPRSACGGPSGPRFAASRARSSQRSASSPASASGGRSSAAIANPPGRRSCSRGEAPPAIVVEGSFDVTRDDCVPFALRVRDLRTRSTLRLRRTAPLVERMNAALVHRGPDDGSVDASAAACSGYRRLRVIDLDHGQPARRERDRRRRLPSSTASSTTSASSARSSASAATRSRGTGDTPVIPHLYEEHGPAFAERLSGMFALALWDAAARAARARARPRRQEAAALDAARRTARSRSPPS